MIVSSELLIGIGSIPFIDTLCNFNQDKGMSADFDNY